MNQIVLKIKHILLPYSLAWVLSPLLFLFVLTSDYLTFFWQWLSGYHLSEFSILITWCSVVELCVMTPRFRHLSIPSNSRVGWFSTYYFMKGDRYFFNVISITGLLLGHQLFSSIYFDYLKGVDYSTGLMYLGLIYFISLLLMSWILFSPLRRWQEEASGEWL